MKYRNIRSLPSHPSHTQRPQKPFFSSSLSVQAKEENAFFQARLKVGQPGDKYEQEADAMAEAVVNDSSGPEVQRMGQEEEELQAKAGPHSPELQRAEDEEELQMQKDDEEELQMKEEEEELQMQEEEEELQMQEQPGGGKVAGTSLSNRITSAAGRGKPLSAGTKAEMESAFSADFSGVSVHTDEESVAMNQGLGAQAFTHGKDVFFNAGKYNPESADGKRLLAHELTHVVQQNGEEVQPENKK
ncbi:MAG: DUF4157 domain-containing protein [Lewinellaceae bacterium]|nr:DUF4157 domain-containing protein [Lewinellaceae bacterium]